MMCLSAKVKEALQVIGMAIHEMKGRLDKGCSFTQHNLIKDQGYHRYHVSAQNKLSNLSLHDQDVISSKKIQGPMVCYSKEI